MQTRKLAVYLIDATIYDSQDGITYRQVFRTKRGFIKSLNNDRYRVVTAVEFPSCFIIKPENIIEWRKNHAD